MKLSEYAGERDDVHFWVSAKPRREPVRARWFLPGVLLALCLSVPWYWADPAPIVAGLPLWVWATLGCSAALSALTGAAAFLAWDDEPETEDDGAGGDAPVAHAPDEDR